jgi:glutamine amidotransferase
MGRLLGYMANRTNRLRDALHQERDVIRLPPSDAPAGWGLGFYQGGEVLHKKRPLLEGSHFDWAGVAGDVRSDCVVIHQRHATVGDFRVENTHPFRMRSWLFAHSGTIDRFDAIRPRLLETMPDFIQRNIRGATDSEHFFHTTLSFLHDSGQLARNDPNDKSVLSALRSTVRLVDRLSDEVGAQKATLNCVLTNGRSMFAVRRGHHLKYVERTGIHDPAEGEPRAERKGPVRYVLVVSDGPEVPHPYVEVPDESVLVVDRDLSVTVYGL